MNNNIGHITFIFIACRGFLIETLSEEDTSTNEEIPSYNIRDMRTKSLLTELAGHVATPKPIKS